VSAPPEGVLFDLDGVLVDSLPAWHAALNALRRGLGLGEVPMAEFEPRFGQSVVDDAAHFFSNRLAPDELSRRYNTAFPSVLHMASRTEPDLDHTLETLRRAGMRLAVTTNSPRETAVALLEAVRVASFFDRIVTADDVMNPKPAPDMLLVACEAIGTTPERVVLIGDSPTDVVAARAAGIHVVSYRTNAAAKRIDSLAEFASALITPSTRHSSPSRGMSSSSKPR
jgi:HAD superfamily hydrolase (TIGR01509 family)